MIGYPHGSQYNPNKSFVNKKKFIKFSVVSAENLNCHYLKTLKKHIRNYAKTATIYIYIYIWVLVNSPKNQLAKIAFTNSPNYFGQVAKFLWSTRQIPLVNSPKIIILTSMNNNFINVLNENNKEVFVKHEKAPTAP